MQEMLTAQQAQLASQQQVLAQVCESVRQLSDTSFTSNPTHSGSGPVPLLTSFWLGNAGVVSAILLRTVTRLAVEADNAATTLSHRILLADSVPVSSTAGGKPRHLTGR